MIIDYNVTKERRKELVTAISKIRGETPQYGGAPWFDYTIGDIKVNRNGKVDIPTLSEAPELISKLLEKGFQAVDPLAEIQEEETTGNEAPEGDEEGMSAKEAGHHCISLPRTLLTDRELDNLKKLLDSRHGLICEALGADDIPVLEEDGKLLFPWFSDPLGPTELKAYMHLVTALIDMAKNAKRVTATEKDTDNHKYAFRCFLLRLGFIGDECKDERKVLLGCLSGNSAFKNGKKGGDGE